MFTSKRRAQASLPLPPRAQPRILHKCVQPDRGEEVNRHLHFTTKHPRCFRGVQHNVGGKKNNVAIWGLDVRNEGFLGIPSLRSRFQQRD